jgi:hypothetical protein
MIQSAKFISNAIAIAHLRVFGLGDSSTPYSGNSTGGQSGQFKVVHCTLPVFTGAEQSQATKSGKAVAGLVPSDGRTQ